MPETRSNIRFHTLGAHAHGLPVLLMIGREWRVAEDQYDWDCRKRKERICIFQYTVSGEGEIEIEGAVHRLPAGQAFLIEAPGPYHYRLPTYSDHWELRFVELSTEALPQWRDIVRSLGRVIDISSHREVEQIMDHIYREADSGAISDVFHNSALAYAFLMHLYRLIHSREAGQQTSDAVNRCLHFIHHNFHLPIGLQEMADASGISRFHLIRVFQQTVGETPSRYLIKMRVKAAATLLVQSSLSVEEIARQTGFMNGNYLAKVFKKWLNQTPSEFRAEAGERQIGQIHIT